ncbi:MAG: hypothetical protein QW597_07355 [Thermoplasmataceae archaeon]
MNDVIRVLPERDFNLPLVREIVISNDRKLIAIRRNAIDCIDNLASDEYKPAIIGNVEFMFILWLLRYFDENIISSKFVNAQRDLLENQLMGMQEEDIEEYCVKTGMPVTYDVETGIFSIPFDKFVKYNTRISGDRYRLSYQPVSRGIVFVDKDLIIKLAREYFVKASFGFMSNLQIDTVREVFALYADFISSLKAVYDQIKSKRRVDLGSVDATKFPPCIREYISEMSAGINLPHLARFTLVAFLHKCGMSAEEIMQLFKTAPDYNEKMTTYQVNHVTGAISGTEYAPPKCSALKSNHLCFMGEDPLCNQEWLKHPLQYYQIKKRSSK